MVKQRFRRKKKIAHHEQAGDLFYFGRGKKRNAQKIINGETKVSPQKENRILTPCRSSLRLPRLPFGADHFLAIKTTVAPIINGYVIFTNIAFKKTNVGVVIVKRRFGASLLISIILAIRTNFFHAVRAFTVDAGHIPKGYHLAGFFNRALSNVAFTIYSQII